jgi:hypothetical protein
MPAATRMTRFKGTMKNGGVGEWLKPAVLKFARWSSDLIQINNLRYAVLHRNGVFWATLAAFCATECATRRILCNKTSRSFPCRELLIPNPAPYAISNSMRICTSSPELLRSR